MFSTLIAATLVMLALALIIGFILAYSKIKLHVTKDVRHEAVLELLPGLNCGACGFPGCDGYANALNTGACESTSLCPPGDKKNLAKIAELLDLTPGSADEEVALVKCQGSPDLAKQDFTYDGLEDCQAAALMFKGQKSCLFGCLGLGTCIRQCPVDAIHISTESLAVVDPELCIGCRKCIPVCPTGVIQMVPKGADYAVLCNASDHGKVTRGNCKVGCIGCKICEKKFPELDFVIDKNLARVNFSSHKERLEQSNTDRSSAEYTEQVQAVVKACPSKCIAPMKPQFMAKSEKDAAS